MSAPGVSFSVPLNPLNYEEINPEKIKELLVNGAKWSQQNFYELLSDWNEYDPKKPHILKNFIGTALFGPPKTEKNINPIKDSLFQYKSSQMEQIDSLYSKIVEHGTQSTEDKTILCGLIYNVIFTKNSIKSVIDKICKEVVYEDYLINSLSPVPVFKVLKNKLQNESIEYYYIDDQGRVYKNWTAYLKNNILPPAFMVVPFEGKYQSNKREQWTDITSNVLLDILESPACHKKVEEVLNTSSEVCGLGGAAISMVSLLTPVGPLIAGAGSVALVGSSVWSLAISCKKLLDRSEHEQSIDITSKEGRNCWLGIANGILAVVSIGARIKIMRNANKGEINTPMEKFRDGAQIGMTIGNGLNVGLSAYNIYENYKKGQRVSSQEVLNFLASLVISGFSIKNLELAKSIIESQQNSAIKEFENSLRSDRHKKEFNDMVNSTKSVIENPTKAKEQVIRAINDIENKDEFFELIVKSRERSSFKDVNFVFNDGDFVINEKKLINPIDFVKGMIETSVSVNTTIIDVIKKDIFELELNNFVSRTKEFVDFVKLKIMEFIYVLTDISEFVNADVIFYKLLELGRKIVKTVMGRVVTKKLLLQAVDFLWAYIKRNMKKRFEKFRNSRSSYGETLMVVINFLYSWIEKESDEWVTAFKKYLEKQSEPNEGLRFVM